VRAITRVTNVDEECDRWLLALAKEGTVADLDRAVRHWRHLRDQERGLDDYLQRWDRRALRPSRTYDVMVVLEVILPVEEGEEVLRLLEVAAAAEDPVEEAVDRGSREPIWWSRRRVDALLDLSERGVVAARGRAVPTATPFTWSRTSTPWPSDWACAPISSTVRRWP
jgi:hypothetical protein